MIRVVNMLIVQSKIIILLFHGQKQNYSVHIGPQAHVHLTSKGRGITKKEIRQNKPGEQYELAQLSPHTYF